MNETIFDIRAYSMRNNLIFYGIPEQHQEEPTSTVKQFIQDNLSKIEWVHRLGKTRPEDGRSRADIKTQPLIAKFLGFQDQEAIRRSAIALKGTNYRVGEQFPKEIHERQKKFFPSI